MRSLGVRVGVGLSSVRQMAISAFIRPQFSLQVFPFIIPLTYFFILPPTARFDSIVGVASAEYAPLPVFPEDNDSARAIVSTNEYMVPTKGASVSLSAADKLRLVRPLLLKYMLPLCMFVPSFHSLVIH